LQENKSTFVYFAEKKIQPTHMFSIQLFLRAVRLTQQHLWVEIQRIPCVIIWTCSTHESFWM